MNMNAFDLDCTDTSLTEEEKIDSEVAEDNTIPMTAFEQYLNSKGSKKFDNAKVLNVESNQNSADIFKPNSSNTSAKEKLEYIEIPKKETQNFQDNRVEKCKKAEDKESEICSNQNNNSLKMGTIKSPFLDTPNQPKAKPYSPNKSNELEKSIKKKISFSTVDLDSLADKMYSLSFRDICENSIKLFAKCLDSVNGHLGFLRWKLIWRNFRKGQIVECTEYKFLLKDDKLLLFEYSGNYKNLRIPAYVGNLPVLYISPNFLHKGIFNNYKVRAVKQMPLDNLLNLSYEEVMGMIRGLTHIDLPNTLVYLPPKVFSGCNNLKSLVIPPSVQTIESNAFAGSGIEHIYFNGNCPKRFNRLIKSLKKSEVKKLFILEEFRETYLKYVNEREESAV